MSVNYAWPFNTWSDLNYCVKIWTICKQPALVCHCPQLPCVRWLEYSLCSKFLSRRRCVIAVVLHCWSHQLITYWVHELNPWLKANLHSVSFLNQTNTHAHFCNVVTLVWGLLRFIPMKVSLIYMYIPVPLSFCIFLETLSFFFLLPVSVLFCRFTIPHPSSLVELMTKILWLILFVFQTLPLYIRQSQSFVICIEPLLFQWYYVC